MPHNDRGTPQVTHLESCDFGVTLMTLAAVAAVLALNVAYTTSSGLYWFVDQGIPIPVLMAR